MIQCQVSLYPLSNPDFRKIIDKCIIFLDDKNVSYTVTSTSTIISGEEKDVFDAVEQMFNLAKKLNKENILLAIYSNACGK